MTVTLIVIGVIAFLAVDAYVLYRVFRSRGRAADHGAIPVPGEAQLSLPAGKLKLTYQESYRAHRTEHSIQFGVPGRLEVEVTSPAGEAMEIKKPGFRGMGAELSTGRDWSRAVMGTVEIAEPGVYTVSAEPELPDAVEPQILAGR